MAKLLDFFYIDLPESEVVANCNVELLTYCKTSQDLLSNISLLHLGNSDKHYIVENDVLEVRFRLNPLRPCKAGATLSYRFSQKPQPQGFAITILSTTLKHSDHSNPNAMSSLRRFGSLRVGNSSFSSTSSTLIDQSDGESLHTFLRNDANLRANPSTSNPTSRSSTPLPYTRPPPNTSLIRAPLVSIDEEETPEPVPLDRIIDRVCVAAPKDIPLPTDTIFGQLRPSLLADRSGDTLFTLPPHIRKRIYHHCFPEESRKINLSPDFVTKAVFPEEWFASPWSVLAPVWGGLQATNMFLRKDLLAYFWTEYSFHVTLSPFTGSSFSPLSQRWLRPYLGIIQNLTLEMDCTRFGGSVLRYAPEFGYDTNKTERLMSDMVEGLADRPPAFGIAELHLMCRRYAGFRPWDGFCVTDDNVPYYPDEAIYLCDTLTELRGIVRRVRVSGFTLEYTEAVLSTIFGEEQEELYIIIPEDSTWPPDPSLPLGALVSASVISRSQYALTLGSLPHSRSFAEEFETEMVRINSFPSLEDATDENYTTEHVIDAVADENETPSKADNNSRPRNSLAEHVRKYSQVHMPAISTNFSNPTPSPTESDITTPRFTHFHDNEIIQTKSTHVVYSSRPVEVEPEPKDIFSEPFPAFSPPSSPPKIQSHSPSKLFRKLSTKKVFLNPAPKMSEELERLNAMNEQDPAFVKAINGLKLADSERADLRLSNDQAGRGSMNERLVTGMGGRQRPYDTTKKKYLSFMDRLRGRADS